MRTIIAAMIASVSTLGIQHYFVTVCPGSPVWCLGLQSNVTQPLAMPIGGPQALEGYLIVSHDRGNTKLAIGTLGNVEMNARGSVSEIRSMQAGGVVTNDGTVEHWSDLTLIDPVARGDYHGPVNVKHFEYIRFGNEWSIRPDGNRLLLCDPRDVCRDLR